MKLSFYNIYIPHGGFTIVYNSRSDKFIGISNHVAVYLNGKAFEVNNFEGLYPSVYDKMKSLGMLICDDIDELASIKQKDVEEKYDNRKLYFMVYPTQDCNLKCWYCYESHKKGTKMTHEVMSSIQKFIDNEIKNNTFDAIHLALFGGEPLLNFTKVANPLTRAIREKCEDSGKAFTSFFVTNASLMTDDIIEKMSELNPYFQITLDGDEPKHDSVRIWKNSSKGTYQQIIHAVNMICKRISAPENIDDPLVTLRINYDNETLRNADYILRDLKDVDRHKVRIHLERVWQTRTNIDKTQQRLLLSAIGKFVNEGFIVSHGVFRRKSIACPSDSMSFFHSQLRWQYTQM